MSSPNISLRAAYAKNILHGHIAKRANKHLENPPSTTLPPPEVAKNLQPPPFKGPICIVGAGAAGLAVAYLLRYADIKEIDIIEASDRVGGRVYTYPFAKDAACPHNYYDVGAMRIPDIAAQQTTIRLIDALIPSLKVPYVYTLGSEPNMYLYNSNPQMDNTQFDNAINGVVKYYQTYASTPEGFAEFNTKYDKYSTRAWLMTDANPPFTYSETERAETFDTSTGLFDQAFIETICDYNDFQEATGKDWWRVEQGMTKLTDALWADIQKATPSVKLIPNSPVVSMEETSTGRISVTYKKDQSSQLVSKEYGMVFNTTTMAALQRMDTSKLSLNNTIRTGIRALSYDRATKVAIKFTQNWWNKLMKFTPKNKHRYGGISSTDLPLGTVVYPSWDDGEDASTVLMISYTWSQDASRMGALVPDYTLVNPSINDDVVQLTLLNLYQLWKDHGGPTLQELQGMYETHHAWAWSHDPYTGGAFALFGPGQFQYLYPDFQSLQCDGKLSICGEATSAHHAWISGALDSAYLSVWGWAGFYGLTDVQNKLKASPIWGGEGGHPAEFDEEVWSWITHLDLHSFLKNRDGQQ